MMTHEDRMRISAALIMSTIGADLARRMLAAGVAPDAVTSETWEACEYAAETLDRFTRAAHEAEHGDGTEALILLSSAEHFRDCMRRRLPDSLDLRVIPGDSAEGIEIIARGEPNDCR